MVVLLLLLVSTSPAKAMELAILETVLYTPVHNGDYVTQSYKLTGLFSPSGTAVSAEGRIIQVGQRGHHNVRTNATHARATLVLSHLSVFTLYIITNLTTLHKSSHSPVITMYYKLSYYYLIRLLFFKCNLYLFL